MTGVSIEPGDGSQPKKTLKQKCREFYYRYKNRGKKILKLTALGVVAFFGAKALFFRGQPAPETLAALMPAKIAPDSPLARELQGEGDRRLSRLAFGLPAEMDQYAVICIESALPNRLLNKEGEYAVQGDSQRYMNYEYVKPGNYRSLMNKLDLHEKRVQKFKQSGSQRGRQAILSVSYLPALIDAEGNKVYHKGSTPFFYDSAEDKAQAKEMMKYIFGQVDGKIHTLEEAEAKVENKEQAINIDIKPRYHLGGTTIGTPNAVVAGHKEKVNPLVM